MPSVCQVASPTQWRYPGTSDGHTATPSSRVRSEQQQLAPPRRRPPTRFLVCPWPHKLHPCWPALCVLAPPKRPDISRAPPSPAVPRVLVIGSTKERKPNLCVRHETASFVTTCSKRGCQSRTKRRFPYGDTNASSTMWESHGCHTVRTQQRARKRALQAERDSQSCGSAHLYAKVRNRCTFPQGHAQRSAGPFPSGRGALHGPAHPCRSFRRLLLIKNLAHVRDDLGHLRRHTCILPVPRAHRTCSLTAPHPRSGSPSPRGRHGMARPHTTTSAKGGGSSGHYVYLVRRH